LTVKRNGQTSILRQGETAVIEPGVWHDWWNASDRDARVRVEITPGERFVHMIETFFGLARLGHTDSKGMPHLHLGRSNRTQVAKICRPSAWSFQNPASATSRPVEVGRVIGRPHDEDTQYGIRQLFCSQQ